MTAHFTSDLHLGHRLVAEKRGFATVEEHDATIAERWRERVRPSDVVYVLGDIAASAPFEALAILSELPGRKRLILGNHDRAHPMHRNAHRWHDVYTSPLLTPEGIVDGAFESIAQSARISVGGIRVLLSHFPYERDRDEPRHMQWRLRDEGMPLLHGHTHGTERLTVTEIEPEARTRVEVHVGLDAWGLAPVPMSAVYDLLPKGPQP
jgi:calcineurin-like phosphoesterase family protein